MAFTERRRHDIKHPHQIGREARRLHKVEGGISVERQTAKQASSPEERDWANSLSFLKKFKIYRLTGGELWPSKKSKSQAETRILGLIRNAENPLPSSSTIFDRERELRKLEEAAKIAGLDLSRAQPVKIDGLKIKSDNPPSK